MILVDLDGAWPSWSDIKKGIKDTGKKVLKGVKDFAKSDIGKVVITSAVIVGIGVASVATGGAAGVVLGSIAAGAAGGAVVGGIGNVVTGGSFANGFVGGALSGGIAAGGCALGNPLAGNFIGGMVGSGATMYLDNPSIEPTKLIIKSAACGLLQGAMGATVGKLFDGAKIDGDVLANSILEYFKSVYDVGGSTVLETIFKIVDMECVD